MITSREPFAGTLRLEYGGSANADSASARLELRAGLRPTEIDWVDERKQVEIVDSTVSLALRLRNAAKPAPHERLSLVIFEQQIGPEVLRSAETTDASGIAHFRLQGHELGAVGSGRLEAVFDGSASLAPSKRSWPILRTCNVKVEPKSFEREVTLGKRAELSVLVEARCTGAVAGMVEFSVQGRPLYRAPVKNGRVTWQFPTSPHRPGPLSVVAKYVPPSEGWFAPEDARFDLLIAPPSTQATVFWFIASIGLAAWLTLKWGRGAIQPLKREPNRRAEGDTSIERIAPEPGKSGWYGVVIDAHTGLPIPGARLHVEHPGFAERQISASTTSTDDGEFVLPVLDPYDLSRLRVEARYYNDGQWPLPPQGRLTIRLQTTRRAILNAFVSWFESSGAKVTPRAEPTPAQVRLVPTHEQSAAVVEWAANVEKAAFGPTKPDRHENPLLFGPPPVSKLGRER